MTIQTLVSAVNEKVEELAKKMNLETDSIIVNQCTKDSIKNAVSQNNYIEYDLNGCKIKCYNFLEKGVGLSRNNALLRATADIILFSDEDIVYDEGYAKKVLQAFEEHPYADMLLFNMEVSKDRATYHTTKEFRVHRYNCGRYPTYSFAIRRDKIHKANITFSLLFGGGAKYSNGEDSIFIRECLKHKFKVYAIPVCLGKEVARPSTWFEGYTEKFFFDRGVLYCCLYGFLAKPLALRYLIKHYSLLFKQQVIPFSKAYSIMKKGMKEWK